MLAVTLSLIEQKVKLASDAILVHLLVPTSLLARTKPVDQTTIVVRWQASNRRFYFFNPVHNGV